MQSVMDQLLHAKQTADESLNQYYNRFKYLDKVVASRTEDWYIGRFEVNCFVKGFLNKTLSDNVCRRYPKTLDEAYQFALEENRLFYMQSGPPQISTQPPPPPKPDNPPAQQGHKSRRLKTRTNKIPVSRTIILIRTGPKTTTEAGRITTKSRTTIRGKIKAKIKIGKIDHNVPLVVSQITRMTLVGIIPVVRILKELRLIQKNTVMQPS